MSTHRGGFFRRLRFRDEARARAGQENDQVVWIEENLRINGELLPASVPLAKDKTGRMMPRDLFNNYTLNESELLLISDESDTFFDDRDFGR